MFICTLVNIICSIDISKIPLFMRFLVKTANQADILIYIILFISDLSYLILNTTLNKMNYAE